MYPSGIDAPSTSMQGTTFFTGDDHALDHRTLGSAIVALENKLGLGVGSAAANQVLVGSGAGTAQWGSVWNLAQLGTPTITTINLLLGGTVAGQIKNSGTVANGVYGTATYLGGTANGMVLGTPTIGTITVPGTVNALSFSAAIAPGVGTITDSAGGTLTVNSQQGNVFYSAMGTAAGNRTIGTPQNPTAYQLLTYAFKASGSANGTIIWPAIFRLSQDIGTPAIGTGTSWNYYAWRYNAIDTKWDYQGQSKNLV